MLYEAAINQEPCAAYTAIDRAVVQLDAWLDTMRGPSGYGGPVAHWWQQSLLYTGAGLDWRYEGIIAGYLALWQNTSDQRWLGKARQAGNDLLAGQSTNGHFRASAFELNPATGGTPHEAACDAALLTLALALRSAGCADWQCYAACAERNVRSFYIGQLWDSTAHSFRDNPHVASFVPNKAATACEALWLLAELSGDEQWVLGYALPTLERIMQHQRRGGPLDGAIAQNSFGTRTVETYFPIYIARCIPALLRGYNWTNDDRFAESALRAIGFVVRWLKADGTLPTAIYANQRVNHNPAWIAPLGDVLRAADLLRPLGFSGDLSAVEQRLLAGQDVSGGIQTATGFAAQAGGRKPGLPDVRDLLHVVGWCDKAFRYLAAHAGPQLPKSRSGPFTAVCRLRGRPMQFVETPDVVHVGDDRQVYYRWRKGAAWPEVAAPAFWLR